MLAIVSRGILSILSPISSAVAQLAMKSKLGSICRPGRNEMKRFAGKLDR